MALDMSGQLLRDLLSKTRAIAADVKGQGGTKIVFGGHHGKGNQVGVNYGGFVSNFS
jgi:hypothetical protein